LISIGRTGVYAISMASQASAAGAYSLNWFGRD
jgi:hypothetical protein